ncbi:MAG: Salicylate 5-hydroxylase, small oxygenase component [Alphaproteobacteria bacterium MarineAlpha11_Bin1]|nr:MAG: Salicylate 5-hydroxylase, small oxygenase component [Alphaproteobacteria bacterium MarineAlpha11_Bin1]|tara:strand:+ start:18950 stop:19444 length:495 start_codon:yes stop_codon:yes gene_type:complete
METEEQTTALYEARREIEDFNYAYAETLDAMDVDGWVDYFTDDAFYHVIARDNAESALPLGLIYCEGKAMMKDRAYALLNTEMFAPRYLHLSITNTRALSIKKDEIQATANYILIETLVEEPSRIQQVGKYRDVFVREGNKLLLKERICTYDSVMIDNCLVFPV